jgi:hypothetical protein
MSTDELSREKCGVDIRDNIKINLRVADCCHNRRHETQAESDCR